MVGSNQFEVDKVYPTGELVIKKGVFTPFYQPDGFKNKLYILPPKRMQRHSVKLQLECGNVNKCIYNSKATIMINSTANSKYMIKVGDYVRFDESKDAMLVTDVDDSKIVAIGVLDVNRLHKIKIKNGTFVDTVNTANIWFLYSGLYAALHNIQHPSGIYHKYHVLGTKRAQYLKIFERDKPDYVVAPSINYPYLDWYALFEIGASWDFYRSLISKYEYIGEAFFENVWKQRSKQNISISNATKNCQPYDLYTGTIHYQVQPKGFIQLVTKKFTRHMLFVENGKAGMPIPLNPNVNVKRFPVLVQSGVKPAIKLVSMNPLWNAENVVIDSITYQHENIPLKNINGLFGKKLSCL
jgi:hypothetical protein